MLLQPYIENAVIHGMRNLNHKGKINVSFKEDQKDEDVLICTIDDNGMGRKN